jgi:hypothetical protein
LRKGWTKKDTHAGARVIKQLFEKQPFEKQPFENNLLGKGCTKNNLLKKLDLL